MALRRAGDLAPLLLLAMAATAQGQERDIQHALVQRDQMTAEFAARLNGGQDLPRLEALHARQLRDALPLAGADPALAPYQRAKMAQERDGVSVLRFAPPVLRAAQRDPRLPLPLPGRPRGGVDPVAPQSLGDD